MILIRRESERLDLVARCVLVVTHRRAAGRTLRRLALALGQRVREVAQIREDRSRLGADEQNVATARAAQEGRPALPAAWTGRAQLPRWRGHFDPKVSPLSTQSVRSRTCARCFRQEACRCGRPARRCGPPKPSGPRRRRPTGTWCSIRAEVRSGPQPRLGARRARTLERVRRIGRAVAGVKPVHDSVRRGKCHRSWSHLPWKDDMMAVVLMI